ncbi:hypothetical protein GCM10010992_12110 [Cloacibacterium rupense]|uniref:DUF4190 domain-containing protein n=1 Tax=Cloacibacterium rupense TaxID=517423 RepID=A0ABQ2NJC3_9FLAO|nr:hypothetical protein [Cloacibacterium rupense]GGP03493.1 hypothetical protein GCM10010992_12110 [Cloacibacterium rupense]
MVGVIILLIVLISAYWVSALVLLISGIYLQRKAESEERKNVGKTRMIIGIIVLIIGGAFCGTILNV